MDRDRERQTKNHWRDRNPRCEAMKGTNNRDVGILWCSVSGFLSARVLSEKRTMDLEYETAFCLRGEPSSCSLLTSKKKYFKVKQWPTGARCSACLILRNKHKNIFYILTTGLSMKTIWFKCVFTGLLITFHKIATRQDYLLSSGGRDNFIKAHNMT